MEGLSTQLPALRLLGFWVDLPGHQARMRGHMPGLAHPWLRHCFKDTKVSISLFSADISKSEEISRWQTDQ